MSLRIDFKLTGAGWAECTIADGEKFCTITASYLSDAFGDLVLSAVTLLHWFNAVSFSFLEEPGEFRWVFTATRENQIELKIFGFDDDPNNPANDEVNPLFRTVCTRQAFGNAVLDAANHLLEEHGEAGYLEKWIEYPFPTERLNELARLIEATKMWNVT